uniref:Putative secreted protein n=1 Tax=Anopheles darlingi TaxID=43151 RepID=A0A2M4DRG5_ANODA
MGFVLGFLAWLVVLLLRVFFVFVRVLGVCFCVLGELIVAWDVRFQVACCGVSSCCSCFLERGRCGRGATGCRYG